MHLQNSSPQKTNKFAHILKKLMKHNLISFRELSKATKISHVYLHRLSVGKSCHPSIDVLKKLSFFFKISTSQLIGEQEIVFKNTSKSTEYSTKKITLK